MGSSGTGFGTFILGFFFKAQNLQLQEVFFFPAIVSSIVLLVITPSFTIPKNEKYFEKENLKTEQKHDENDIFIETSLRLFKSYTFWLLVLSTFLSWLAQVVPYAFLEGLQQESVNSSQTGTNMIMPYYGLFSSVGKIGFGMLCMKSCKWWTLSPLKTFISAQVLFGIAIAILPLVDMKMRFGLVILSAILSGCYPLVMVYTQTLLSIKARDASLDFTIGYGYMLVFEAIGCYIGPPIAGKIYDLTQSYTISFLATGASILLSGVILLPKLAKEKLVLSKDCDIS